MLRILPVAALLSSLLPAVAVAQQPRQNNPGTQASVTDDHERRIKLLEAQVRSLQTRTTYRYAALDCNTGKYDEFLFLSGNLVFLASCTKIEPYLEGHRVTISVGNPHFFNFSNVKGTHSYGKDWADAIERNVEVSMTDSIRAGSWTTVTVIINPSKPEQLRYLGLELNAQSASATR
jgi:hypothetical protein